MHLFASFGNLNFSKLFYSNRREIGNSNYAIDFINDIPLVRTIFPLNINRRFGVRLKSSAPERNAWKNDNARFLIGRKESPSAFIPTRQSLRRYLKTIGCNIFIIAVTNSSTLINRRVKRLVETRIPKQGFVSKMAGKKTCYHGNVCRIVIIFLFAYFTSIDRYPYIRCHVSRCSNVFIYQPMLGKFLYIYIYIFGISREFVSCIVGTS